MGFFSNLYRTLLGINSEQTWKKIDWQGNEAVIAEKIKDFLALGADVNDTDCKEKIALQDNVIYKETPLARAIKNHKFQVAELLVERGAKNDKRANVKKHFCLLVTEHNKYVHMEKMKAQGMDDPMLPFDKKFQQGDLEKMEHLMDVMLQHGFDVNEADPQYVEKSGRNASFADPLTTAAQVGNLRLVKFLHARGGKINHEEITTSGTAMFKSSIGAAVASGDMDTLKYLYDNGGKINPDKLSAKEPSPISRAVINKNEEVADFLLSKNCDVNMATEGREWTSLMYAALIENEKIAEKWVDKLLTHSADATKVNTDGQTASQVAMLFYKKEKLSQKLEIMANKQKTQRQQEQSGVSSTVVRGHEEAAR